MREKVFNKKSKFLQSKFCRTRPSIRRPQATTVQGFTKDYHTLTWKLTKI